MAELQTYCGASAFPAGTSMSISGWLLRKACRSGELGEVRALLEDDNVRAHINDSCARGHSPLHRAASRGNVEVAKLLLGASP